MEEIIVLNSVNKYCKDNNQEVLHPLVSVVDLSKIPYRKKGKFKVNIGLYCILLKDVKCGDVRYSKHTYDYQEGTLMFLAVMFIQLVKQKKHVQLAMVQSYQFVLLKSKLIIMV